MKHSDKTNHSYELALIQGLALCKGKSDKDLHDLYKDLIRETTTELKKLPGLTRKEITKGQSLTKAFEQVTGWGRKRRPVHMMSLISFCCEMIEKSKFHYPKRLLKVIVDIVDWYEVNDGLKALCFYAGEIAYKKWCEVKKVGWMAVKVKVSKIELPRFKPFDPGRLCIPIPGRTA